MQRKAEYNQSKKKEERKKKEEAKDTLLVAERKESLEHGVMVWGRKIPISSKNTKNREALPVLQDGNYTWSLGFGLFDDRLGRLCHKMTGIDCIGCSLRFTSYLPT